MGTITEHIMENLYVVGVLTLVYVGFKLLYGAYSFYNMYFTEAAVDYKSFGKWALVTGSTDGIGKGIAIEIAKRGINIILVSRNPDKLKSVAQEIETQFEVQTKCVTIDFSNCDDMNHGEITSSMYDVISNAIQGLEVGILVNNVGLGASGIFLDAFKKSTIDTDISAGIPKLIYCNDMSMARVTQLVLSAMVERRNGLIINVSSVTASAVIPKLALYSGSKKFNDTFSKALGQEYKDKGIIVQSIRPGWVSTNMVSGAGLYCPTYKTYAQYLMNTIGKGHMSTGYWVHHGLLHLPFMTMPQWLISRLCLQEEK